MSIVITEIRTYPQPSGGVDVTEIHTDHLGQQYAIRWRATDQDINAVAAQHALDLEAQLAQSEIDGILNG